MSKRVSFIASVMFAMAVAGSGWAQRGPSHGNRPLPGYDARDLASRSESGAAGRQLQARMLVERRKAGIGSFLASESAANPGVRVTPNRYGIPKLFARDGAALTAPSRLDPETVARDFLKNRSAVFAFAPSEVDGMRLVTKDDAGAATFLTFNQTVGGIDVFQGQVKLTLSKAGEVVQAATGDAAPGIAVSATPRLTPEQAVAAAYRYAGAGAPGKLARTPGASGASGVAFANPRGGRYNPISAELNVFPLNAASARLAYRVILDYSSNACYEMLVDANDGSLLYRHNLYVRQTAQGKVWTTQAPATGADDRTVVPFPSAWFSGDGTVTTGGYVDAYLDSDGNDRADSVSSSGLLAGRAYSAAKDFAFEYGDGLTGKDPRTFQAASVTNLFYLINAAHDYYATLGFDGLKDTDSVMAGAQNPDYDNNAAFAPVPPGQHPHLRMGIFTRGTTTRIDDLDTDYDAQVVFHEYGHGVSNRLVGGNSTSCLSGIQSGALGEGWSDYFSISYTGIPVVGAYLTQKPEGIRRHSYAGYPYMYEHLGNTGYEVHDDGEIWAATLWDLRTALGQATTDQLVMSGLKGTPCSPSMTDARDAILAADQAASAGSHRAAIWQVFANHGLGYSAAGEDGNLLTGTRYDSAYDLPPADAQHPTNPAITSDPLTVAVGAGEAYPYTIAATNPNAGTLNFSLTAGPSGMTVDPAGGAVGWTATFTGQRVKVTVTDGKNGKVIHGYLAPVLTNMTPGSSLAIAGAAYSAGFARLTVPAGIQVLQVTLRGGTGDSDLYVNEPGSGWNLSGRYNSDETLSFLNPATGEWLIEVDGYDDYSGVTLAAASVTPAPLGLNTTLTGLSGPTSSETLYRITIPSGARSLSVSTSGGTGDVDLFLKKGAPALCQYADYPEGADSPCNQDNESATVGNSESINVNGPAAADWYLDLSAYSAYSGITLTTAFDSAMPFVTLQAALPNGYVGGAYSQPLTAVGGTAPYSWSATGLPPGLAVVNTGSGWVISGKPTAAGTFSVTLTATDSAQSPMSGISQPLALTILGGANVPNLVRTGVLSQIAAGNGAMTTAWLINNSANTVHAQVVFYQDGGTEWPFPMTVTQQGVSQSMVSSRVDVTLAPHAPAIISTAAGVSGNLQGWADVLSDGAISGFAIFDLMGLGEGTVPLETRFPTALVLPFDNTGKFLTGVALCNLSASPATITATIWDENGVQQGPVQTISDLQPNLKPGNGHTAFMLQDLAATKGIKGTVLFKTTTSGAAILGLGLRAIENMFTSVPTIPQ